ncbi:uncharacterized protein LOC129764470 [Toxorhynchites rutilus septentrionalis]|uniref:uncharacterized protein LOC129764470 n=1 Tax=Toxorhynchites rutilus septentrionalis TaxID=329112 RepID=UPI0024783321|nr:uncharacterized protein LOC129764470 [Toxorhynchites rutilus septentrionalis]
MNRKINYSKSTKIFPKKGTSHIRTMRNEKWKGTADLDRVEYADSIANETPESLVRVEFAYHDLDLIENETPPTLMQNEIFADHRIDEFIREIILRVKAMEKQLEILCEEKQKLEKQLQILQERMERHESIRNIKLLLLLLLFVAGFAVVHTYPCLF